MTGQPLIAEMVYGFVGETPVNLAYLGPGAGLAAIGALFTMTVVAIFMVTGFVWYPLQRLRAAYANGAGKPPAQRNWKTAISRRTGSCTA